MNDMSRVHQDESPAVKTLAILKAARELISVPERWTTGTYARFSALDEIGCEATHPAASCWCARGALRKAAFPGGVLSFESGPEERAAYEALARSGCHLYGEARRRWDREPVSHVNDTLGWQATLDMFDRAIATMESAAPQ